VKRALHSLTDDSVKLIAAGILLITLPFTPIYSGFFDWPAAIRFGRLGFGGISAGAIYILTALFSFTDLLEKYRRFSIAVVAALSVAPILILLYRLSNELGIFGYPVSLRFILISACTYLPIAFGVPVGCTTNRSYQLGVVLLAGILVTVPAYQTLQAARAAGGFVQIVPIGWVGTLIYDGVLAYPLYRFTKSQSGRDK